ncbi:putative nmra-like family protein [Neofusicoccum parvum]|nr:putative nmra-like family protein [Neofusicoccum parvum]
MVNVAVAGGLGNVGKTIVEVLHNDKRHNVVAFSRKVPEISEYTVLAVDYGNVESLTETLMAHRIHTVISALTIMDDSAGQAQINLIRAASQSSTTVRFVASEYGLDAPQNVVELMPHHKWRADAIEELRGTSLEFTRIYNGLFLDYFATPEIKTYQTPLTFALDIQNKFAAVPGTGNDLVVFNYTFDIAQYISAMLTLPKWAEKTNIVSDRMTFNEFISLAEEARGQKFEVHYDDIDKLKRFEITRLPSHVTEHELFPIQMDYVWAVFGRWVAEGHFDLPLEGSLNQKFPEIKPLTIRAMLDQFWKGK